MMAVGVASPRAHGQAITRIAIATWRAKTKLSPLAKYQNKKVIKAIVITAGTKTPATLSAILAIGALVCWASSTSLMIWAKRVSSPTFSARMVREPCPLIEAPNTLSSATFSTGILSPVSIDSSIAECPDTT